MKQLDPASRDEAALRVHMIGETVQCLIDQLATCDHDLVASNVLGEEEVSLIMSALGIIQTSIDRHFEHAPTRAAEITELTLKQFIRIKDRHTAIGNLINSIEKLMPVMHDAPTRPYHIINTEDTPFTEGCFSGSGSPNS